MEQFQTQFNPFQFIISQNNSAIDETTPIIANISDKRSIIERVKSIEDQSVSDEMPVRENHQKFVNGNLLLKRNIKEIEEGDVDPSSSRNKLRIQKSLKPIPSVFKTIKEKKRAEKRERRSLGRINSAKGRLSTQQKFEKLIRIYFYAYRFLIKIRNAYYHTKFIQLWTKVQTNIRRKLAQAKFPLRSSTITRKPLFTFTMIKLKLRWFQMVSSTNIRSPPLIKLNQLIRSSTILNTRYMCYLTLSDGTSHMIGIKELGKIIRKFKIKIYCTRLYFRTLSSLYSKINGYLTTDDHNNVYHETIDIGQGRMLQHLTKLDVTNDNEVYVVANRNPYNEPFTNQPFIKEPFIKYEVQAYGWLLYLKYNMHIDTYCNCGKEHPAILCEPNKAFALKLRCFLEGKSLIKASIKTNFRHNICYGINLTESDLIQTKEINKLQQKSLTKIETSLVLYQPIIRKVQQKPLLMTLFLKNYDTTEPIFYQKHDEPYIAYHGSKGINMDPTKRSDNGYIFFHKELNNFKLKLQYKEETELERFVGPDGLIYMISTKLKFKSKDQYFVQEPNIENNQVYYLPYESHKDLHIIAAYKPNFMPVNLKQIKNPFNGERAIPFRPTKIEKEKIDDVIVATKLSLATNIITPTQSPYSTRITEESVDESINLHPCQLCNKETYHVKEICICTEFCGSSTCRGNDPIDIITTIENQKDSQIITILPTEQQKQLIESTKPPASVVSSSSGKSTHQLEPERESHEHDQVISLKSIVEEKKPGEFTMKDISVPFLLQDSVKAKLDRLIKNTKWPWFSTVPTYRQTISKRSLIEGECDQCYEEKVLQENRFRPLCDVCFVDVMTRCIHYYNRTRDLNVTCEEFENTLYKDCAENDPLWEEIQRHTDMLKSVSLCQPLKSEAARYIYTLKGYNHYGVKTAEMVHAILRIAGDQTMIYRDLLKETINQGLNSITKDYERETGQSTDPNITPYDDIDMLAIEQESGLSEIWKVIINSGKASKTQILKQLTLDVFQDAFYHIWGPFGTGKSYQIRRLCKPNDLIVCGTFALKLEYVIKLCAEKKIPCPFSSTNPPTRTELNEFLNGKKLSKKSSERVNQLSGKILPYIKTYQVAGMFDPKNPNTPNIDVTWVDECFMNTMVYPIWTYWFGYKKSQNPKAAVVMIGDPKQVNAPDFNNILPSTMNTLITFKHFIEFLKPDHIHFLNVSFRCALDTIHHMIKQYNYPENLKAISNNTNSYRKRENFDWKDPRNKQTMSVKQGDKLIKGKGIKGEGDHQLIFHQGDKKTFFWATSNTVAEFQGSERKKIDLYIRDEYKCISRGHEVVALTRHIDQCNVYYQNKCNTFNFLFNKNKPTTNDLIKYHINKTDIPIWKGFITLRDEKEHTMDLYGIEIERKTEPIIKELRYCRYHGRTSHFFINEESDNINDERCNEYIIEQERICSEPVFKHFIEQEEIPKATCPIHPSIIPSEHPYGDCPECVKTEIQEQTSYEESLLEKGDTTIFPRIREYNQIEWDINTKKGECQACDTRQEHTPIRCKCSGCKSWTCHVNQDLINEYEAFRDQTRPSYRTSSRIEPLYIKYDCKLCKKNKQFNNFQHAKRDWDSPCICKQENDQNFKPCDSEYCIANGRCWNCGGYSYKHKYWCQHK